MKSLLALYKVEHINATPSAVIISSSISKWFKSCVYTIKSFMFSCIGDYLKALRSLRYIKTTPVAITSWVLSKTTSKQNWLTPMSLINSYILFSGLYYIGHGSMLCNDVQEGGK